MADSQLKKLGYVMSRVVAHPRQSLSHLWLGHLAHDRGHLSQPVWLFGELPRVPLASALPGAEGQDVHLPRALDRSFGTSVTPEEACCLCAIEKHVAARRVLEIGTFDGNTTLALAANFAEGGTVTTLDLPPDFDHERDRASLAIASASVNVTPRDRVGIQFRSHPLAARIRQVFGDSAAVDWSTLGGPFDLIFVDGSHTAAYVESDTTNALRNLSEPGAIVWHDYGLYEDVSTVVDRFAREERRLEVFAIERTRLAVGLHGVRAR